MKKVINIALSITLGVVMSATLFTGESIIFAQVDKQQDESDTESDLSIVTEETAKPVANSKDMLNVAMGNEDAITNRRARSVNYEPYWKNDGGIKSFYDGYDRLVYNVGSKLIIDVSEHNGTIDWQKVKDSGVDGAIIRIGFGYLGLDKQAYRNINECNRLGIPYGIYLYSYAYDANFAYAEAVGTAEMLSKTTINLTFPIFYDIERFSPWTDDDGSIRSHPTTVAGYESVIGTFINEMNNRGYSGKVHVYSYRSMLTNELNSKNILSYVSWAAEYGPNLQFTNNYYKGVQGWQYTSDGTVPGISGRVDLNCFGDFMFDMGVSTAIPSNLEGVLNGQSLKFNQGYVTGFALSSDISTLLKSLKSIGSVTCYNGDGVVINEGIVKTGQKIRITMVDGTAYMIGVVIRGDVNGDGKFSSLDYVKIRNKLDSKSSLKGAFEQAADVNGDGKISSLDYVKIRNQLDGKSTITQ